MDHSSAIASSDIIPDPFGPAWSIVFFFFFTFVMVPFVDSEAFPFGWRSFFVLVTDHFFFVFTFFMVADLFDVGLQDVVGELWVLRLVTVILAFLLDAITLLAPRF